ncbi:Folylpolyglutamate synthase [Pleurostoma richardsiae]|uniref:Folylpolyglutamate synthase n=1 Tax=Pleurostoma richardsiae TaxID=41990 RepID=A0AA38VT54_9PEZI|nr:Folylpolyglutamate synthase [Pleurostoma richardsiae]
MSTLTSSPVPSSHDSLVPTYDNALHLLSRLQSNKFVVDLFASEPASDLNARAIPEVVAWLARAGYKQSDLARLHCVHVAGTKGKGSVCAFLTSILRNYPGDAGRVGTYTSPHLVDVRERIMLDGRPISKELFTRYFFETWNRLSQAAREAGDVVPEDAEGMGVDGPATKPFYFRFLTILAFHVFFSEGVQTAVVECGIGGEYDSTNVLPPEAVTASVVTQLGIDHVAMLGDTVEKIAWNKAGIFKRGRLAFTRLLENQDGVMKILRDRASEKGATLVEIRDSSVEKWGGVRDANLEGPFQKYNMALAAAAARRHLRVMGRVFEGDFGKANYKFHNLPEPFLTGLKDASLRGRCETVVQGNIHWHLDGAHTADSLIQVGRWFASKAKDRDCMRILVFNQQERDSTALLQALLESIQGEANFPDRKVFHSAFCPRNEQAPAGLVEPARNLTVQRSNCEVVRKFCPFTRAAPADSVQTALDLAKSMALAAADKEVKILVTGSFHLVGPVLKELEPGDEP